MLDLDGKLRLHEQCKVSTVRVGAEGEVVVVVDNFLSSPQLLIEYAVAHSTFDTVSDAFYPGSRAPVPPIYCFALRGGKDGKRLVRNCMTVLLRVRKPGEGGSNGRGRGKGEKLPTDNLHDLLQPFVVCDVRHAMLLLGSDRSKHPSR